MKIWTLEEEAERLKKRFEGKNRAEFARDNNIKGGQAIVYQHITGRRPISRESALAYAKGFGVPLREISPRLANEAINLLSGNEKLINGDEFVEVRSAKIHKKVEEAIILMMGQDDICLDMCLTSIKKAIEVRKAEKAALPKPTKEANRNNTSSVLEEVFDDLDPDKYVNVLSSQTIQAANVSQVGTSASVQDQIIKSRQVRIDRVNEIVKGESRPLPDPQKVRKGQKKL